MSGFSVSLFQGNMILLEPEASHGFTKRISSYPD